MRVYFAVQVSVDAEDPESARWELETLLDVPSIDVEDFEITDIREYE